MRSPLALPTLLCALALATAACEGSGGSPGPDGPLHPWAEQARLEIPDTLTLHTRVVARSCAPNGGVCHNGKEYPDLHTVGNFVTAVSRPCNMDLADEPEEVFDGCEPEGDVLRAGSYKTRIGRLGPEEYDPYTGSSGRPIRVAEPAPKSFIGADARFERGGDLLVEAEGVLFLAEGATEGWLRNLYNLDYPSYLALASVAGGDPNGNGVYGAEDAWAEIHPGRPEKSYLWARITGTVPGTRMPLANQALSNPEYVAIACWIETIGRSPRADQAIDYEGCRYARAPGDYEWTPS